MAGLFGTGVGAPRLDPVAIQPAGVPGSTFVRPQQVSEGGNFVALAESLGGLNRALQGYAQTRAAQDLDPNSRTLKAFLDSIQGKDTAALQQMAANGEFANDIQQDGLNALLGSKANSDFRNSTLEWYEMEFDKNGGDLATELEQRRQATAAALPDEASRAAFFRGSEEWTQRFLAGDIERRTQVATASRNEAVVDEFRLIADDALAAGSSPEDAASQIIRQSGLNREFRGLSGQEQNATLFALAQEYALQGQPELVRALLENDRGGIGALVKTSDFSVKGLQLIEAAQERADDTAGKNAFDLYVSIDREIAAGTLTDRRMREIVEQNPHLREQSAQTSAWVQQSSARRQQTAEQAERNAAARSLQQEAGRQEQAARANASQRLSTMMGAQTIEDIEVLTATGGTRTYTRQAQIDDAVNLYQERFRQTEQQRIQQGMTPEQAADATLRDKVNFFAGNAIPNPEWERTFNASVIVGSVSQLAAGGEVPARLGEIAETYHKIAKLNPAFAASLVKGERAVEFLEAYSDARDDVTLGAGAGPQDALLEAARLANRSPAERQATFTSRADAERVVKSAMSSGWFFGPSVDGNFRTNPQNTAAATDLVQRYMGRGMTESAAIERAKKVLSDQAVYVNGVAILGTGRNFPQDFPEAAEGFLEGFARGRNPEASGDNLYLMDPNDGTDRFIILRKEDGLPVGTVNNSDLDGWRRTQRDEAVQQEARWGRNVERDGPFVATLKWVGSGFQVAGGNMSTEQAESFLADQREQQTIDAFVRRQAENDNIRYDGINGRWLRRGGFLGMGQTEVRPEVVWSGAEKSVRWVPAD